MQLDSNVDVYTLTMNSNKFLHFPLDVIQDITHRKPFINATWIDQQVVNHAMMPKSLPLLNK